MFAYFFSSSFFLGFDYITFTLFLFDSFSEFSDELFDILFKLYSDILELFDFGDNSSIFYCGIDYEKIKRKGFFLLYPINIKFLDSLKFNFKPSPCVEIGILFANDLTMPFASFLSIP